MAYQLVFHADDFGLTKGSTDGILHACDAGVISSVSIFPNAPAFEYGIEQLKARPSIKLSIHLNFCDGPAISEAKHVDFLVDGQGEFCHTFPGLWFRYYCSSPKVRQQWQEQVKREMRAQILKVMEARTGAGEVRVDSHNHTHLIPFIFTELLALTKELKIDYIRVPQEQFFWHIPDADALGNYVSENVIKHFLLNHLSSRWTMTLNRSSIKYPCHFIGVLFTGRMTQAAANAALHSIGNGEGAIEVLFHPGRACEDELKGWTQNKMFNDYACSLGRDKELEELLKFSIIQGINRGGI